MASSGWQTLSIIILTKQQSGFVLITGQPPLRLIYLSWCKPLTSSMSTIEGCWPTCSQPWRLTLTMTLGCVCFIRCACPPCPCPPTHQKGTADPLARPSMLGIRMKQLTPLCNRLRTFIATLQWRTDKTKSTEKILRVIRHPQHFSRPPIAPTLQKHFVPWIFDFELRFSGMWEYGVFSLQLLSIGRFALGHDGTVMMAPMHE